MKRKAFLNVAATSLIAAIPMVGCSGTLNQTFSAADRAQTQAGSNAASAEKALAKRDGAAAVIAAEAAVAATPDSAAYRVLLARSYLADGRFRSAETTFEDAMTLGSADARTIVSLALAKVALGKSDAARALLSGHMDTLPVADYGLAMAMAGDPDEAVRVLSQAIQDPSADAKTRQNLAYAYALSGRWRDARIMAGEDMDPLAAAQRIAMWAETAQAGAESYRVAALVGVEMRADDAGQPQQLALAQPAATQMAEAPAEAAPVAAEAPVEVALAAEAIPVEAPVIYAPSAPARQPVIEAPRMAANAVKAMMRRVALIKPVDAGAASNWVVQLGAYDSAAVMKERWQRMARNAGLSSFPVSHTTITVNGQLFHRLAISGFSDRAAARQMCRSIKASRGQCFIREGVPGLKAERWAASAKPKQLAMR